MDELAMVRAELVRLEENERKLIDQLSAIRAAAAVHRKRIDELIRTRGPLIQRLPVELFSSILHLALRGTNPSQKEILTRVSRRWRDVILDQPSFWTTIEIVSGQNLGRVTEYLKKSLEAPLDITVRTEWDESYDTIREGLDLVVRCANRWRSLSIYTSFELPVLVAPLILDRIGAIKFPFLQCVKLNLRGDAYLTFLSPTNLPILEYLDIRNDHHKLRLMPGTLVALHHIDFNKAAGMAFSNHIPVLTLVTLSLSGDMLLCSLQPDSVHFPVLETLTIKLRNAEDFLKAIVTPKLKSLDYTIGSENPRRIVFSSLEDKFSSVRQVSFTIAFNSLDTLDALALCRAFPHVYHAGIYSESPLSAFFGPCEGTNDLQSPAGYWKSLESVSFREIDPDMWLEPPIRESNAFVQWLMARQDQQPLRVRIEDVDVQEEDVGSFCMLYDILQEYCAVELEDIRLWTESELKSADSRLQLHVRMFTPGLADDIGVVVGGIGTSEQSSHT
ncbi:hypothetical protein EDC04DRAFT_2905020 [Pisolithus marmoratus]|nr:hypothetical protein EDC04DRAFT_2905020 [Pisolithus marmoratus]